MPKLPRVFLDRFGADGPNDDFAQFGSQTEGSPLKTKNIALIQALDAWKNGWKDAINAGNRAPYLEDMNGFCYVMAYMQNYLFQEGIPEWDATTVYFIGSIVKKTGTSELYASRIDDNSAHALPSQQTDSFWEYLGTKLNGYRRPVMQWNDKDTIDMEAQTGIAHTSQIMFPDGSVRTVLENLATTQKYRRFDKDITAEWQTGTEASGMRSGLTPTSGLLYYMYAVKSQIDETKFVMVGDNTEPVAANVATLNTRYGTNGWVYLGMFAMLDYFGTLQILAFSQYGAKTVLGVSDITLPGPIVLPNQDFLFLASVTLTLGDTFEDVWIHSYGENFAAGELPSIMGMATFQLEQVRSVSGPAAVEWGVIGIYPTNPQPNGGFFTSFKGTAVGAVISTCQFTAESNRSIAVARTAAGGWPENNCQVSLEIYAWEDRVLAAGLNNII